VSDHNGHQCAYVYFEDGSQAANERCGAADCGQYREAAGSGAMGLSSITDKQKEAAWRVEFKALGEQLVFQNLKRGAIYNDEAKRQAALRWLSERDRTAQVAWLAFFAAIAGMLTGIIGLLVATY
jgi:hypothetical protein